ncbi:hypothetical protein C5167_035206 [Papaver somniferum]|uniref:TRP C-terminal domain-containing protein n=1 Tax=Papaver somniferum TaxID=3469 RepID=A0A4Y7KJF4_PAPSO|nr:hypothetical protein C5167_035206 [Papaver somniferum]
MRTVQATNNYKSLHVYLYFSEPVLNSTKEIQRFIHTNQGLLHPLYGKSRGNRRFIFLVKDVPDVAVVTISVESSSIISRQGTPVSPISPVTFLYDSRRPSVKLSTTSNMRTKEDTVPFLIQFSDPVFYFNSSSLTISGGHFQRQLVSVLDEEKDLCCCIWILLEKEIFHTSESMKVHDNNFRAISQSVYSVDIHADENLVSICVLENTTRDVAGNSNLASNMLYVRHYAVPLVSYMVSAFATAVFALTSLAAGLLTVATASLHSIKRSSRSSSLADPARILFRTACHIQVFALSRWLAVTLPVEYYEFTRGLQWSIPYLSLPWEGEYVRSVMVDSSPRSMPHSEFSTTYEPRLFANPRSGEAKLDIAPSIAGLPLTPMEYTSFFVLSTLLYQNKKSNPDKYMFRFNVTRNMKIEGALFCRWREFERNMFWLAVFGGSLLLLHGLILILLKWKRNSEEKKYSGALVLPRFQIFLTILALPCICQASKSHSMYILPYLPWFVAANILISSLSLTLLFIEGGETWQEIVGILLLGVLCFLLVVLLLFLSVGITMGKLLQYKEVHQEGQKFHWYQEIIRVTLGPGKRGQWTWKNQSNSVYLTMLGPLIYYTLLESVKRVAIGIVAGLYSANNTSSTPTLVLLCITSFQLFFLVLKKPFIKKRVQLVEIISVLCEVGIFATCLILIQREFSFGCETRIGIFMILLFLIGFTSQIISEWHALYKQIYRLGSGDKRFVSGLKTTLFGLLVIFIPRDLLKKLEVQLQNGETGDPVSSTDQNRSSGSRKSSGGSADKPWLKRLSELAKSSFSKDGSGTSKDPSTSRFFWSGKRSGSSSLASSADFKSRSKTMYRDLEDIFSSR